MTRLLVLLATILAIAAVVLPQAPAAAQGVDAVTLSSGSLPPNPTRDADGWTIFTPTIGDTNPCTTASGGLGTYSGTCITYLSYSTGSNGNDCNTNLGHSCCVAKPPLDPNFATPCKTIAFGSSFSRANKPDWMVFRRGDTWPMNEGSNNRGAPNKGRSSLEPNIWSCYGPDNTASLPIIEFSPAASQAIVTITGAGDYSFVAFNCLEAYGPGKDPNNANYSNMLIQFAPGFVSNSLPTTWMLLEDVHTSYQSGILTTQGYSNLGPQLGTTIIRRSTSHHHWTLDARTQGAFIRNVANFVVEDSVFYENGWNKQTSTPAAVSITNPGATSPAVLTWSGTSWSPANQSASSLAIISFDAAGGGIFLNKAYCLEPLGGNTFYIQPGRTNDCSYNRVASTTNGSTTMTVASSFGATNIPVGTVINNANVPAGTIVSATPNSTTVTMSAAATADSTNSATQFRIAGVSLPTAPNAKWWNNVQEGVAGNHNMYLQDVWRFSYPISGIDVNNPPIAYLDGVTDQMTTLNGNISASASLNGFSARNGGQSIYNNLLWGNPNAIATSEYRSGIRSNVILNASVLRSVTGGSTAPTGMLLGLSIGDTVSDNVLAFSNGSCCGNTAGIRIEAYSGGTSVVNVGGTPISPAMLLQANAGFVRENIQFTFDAAWGGSINAWQLYYVHNGASWPGGGGNTTWNISTAPDGAGVVSSVNTTSYSATLVSVGKIISSNILWQWNQGTGPNGGAIPTYGSDGHGNTFSGNEIDCTTCYLGGAYPGCGTPASVANCTVAGYDRFVLVGPGTEDHFVACALANRRYAWDDRCTAKSANNWIRAGFGRAAIN